METVARKHPADTTESEAVQCPKCRGTGKNRFGNVCGTADEDRGGCLGPGFIMQQRFDSSGRAVRVQLSE